MSVRDQVREALHNAYDNGYDVRGMSTYCVVVDLMTYDADLEKLTYAEIEPYVIEWKEDPLWADRD